MANENKLSELEALLYAAGDPLDLATLASCSETDQEVCVELLHELQEKLEEDKACGLCLREIEGRWLLTIKLSCKESCARLFRPGHQAPLSSAAYETLAAVLYNQPVTRAQVEEVRGVNSDGIMSRLEERGLIESCGVLEQVGRPALFRVSERFLIESGLRSAEDIPAMDLLMVDSLRQWEESADEQKPDDCD